MNILANCNLLTLSKTYVVAIAYFKLSLPQSVANTHALYMHLYI